jgi:hypothetical protein
VSVDANARHHAFFVLRLLVVSWSIRLLAGDANFRPGFKFDSQREFG